jgi:hypothetical protein
VLGLRLVLRLDLGQEVELTHLRLEKTFEGSMALDHGEGEVRTIFDGRGPRPSREPGSSAASARA